MFNLAFSKDHIPSHSPRHCEDLQGSTINPWGASESIITHWVYLELSGLLPAADCLSCWNVYENLTSFFSMPWRSSSFACWVMFSLLTHWKWVISSFWRLGRFVLHLMLREDLHCRWRRGLACPQQPWSRSGRVKLWLGGGRGGGLPSPGASSGVTEGSCWFGPWELRVGFGCLACLMVPNSQRDIAAFYYILWPIRTKHSIVLGSHTAQYTGCCGDGSPSLLRPTLPPERDPQNCLSTYHLYQKVSLSVVGLCPSLPSLRWLPWISLVWGLTCQAP